eukprot:GHVQ01023376.1.p1 GENE.GHVQ01023376.1~~GHVQ01023376.1.p1  ORF type:complete len:556 (+),score=50.24 GHVQ01023376.1:1636-3303(+)
MAERSVVGKLGTCKTSRGCVAVLSNHVNIIRHEMSRFIRVSSLYQAVIMLSIILTVVIRGTVAYASESSNGSGLSSLELTNPRGTVPEIWSREEQWDRLLRVSMLSDLEREAVVFRRGIWSLEKLVADEFDIVDSMIRSIDTGLSRRPDAFGSSMLTGRFELFHDKLQHCDYDAFFVTHQSECEEVWNHATRMLEAFEEMKLSPCSSRKSVLIMWVHHHMRNLQERCADEIFRSLQTRVCESMHRISFSINEKCLASGRYLEEHKNACEENRYYTLQTEALPCAMDQGLEICRDLGNQSDTCSSAEYYARHIQSCEDQKTFLIRTMGQQSELMVDQNLQDFLSSLSGSLTLADTGSLLLHCQYDSIFTAAREKCEESLFRVVEMLNKCDVTEPLLEKLEGSSFVSSPMCMTHKWHVNHVQRKCSDIAYATVNPRRCEAVRNVTFRRHAECQLPSFYSEHVTSCDDNRLYAFQLQIISCTEGGAGRCDENVFSNLRHAMINCASPVYFLLHEQSCEDSKQFVRRMQKNCAVEAFRGQYSHGCSELLKNAWNEDRPL